MAAPEQARTASLRVLPAPQESNAIVLLISGAITPAWIPVLCERVRRLLESTGQRVIVCDLDRLSKPDAATVDALSRVQLTARRLGCEIRVGRAPEELSSLIELLGLSDVLPGCSGVEAEGQSEQREEPGGVEKERDPGDPVA